MEEAVAAAGDAAMALTMDTVLEWVGFENVATRDRLRAEGINSCDDLKSMK